MRRRRRPARRRRRRRRRRSVSSLRRRGSRVSAFRTAARVTPKRSAMSAVLLPAAMSAASSSRSILALAVDLKGSREESLDVGSRAGTTASRPWGWMRALPRICSSSLASCHRSDATPIASPGTGAFAGLRDTGRPRRRFGRAEGVSDEGADDDGAFGLLEAPSAPPRGRSGSAVRTLGAPDARRAAAASVVVGTPRLRARPRPGLAAVHAAATRSANRATRRPRLSDHRRDPAPRVRRRRRERPPHQATPRVRPRTRERRHDARSFPRARALAQRVVADSEPLPATQRR